MFIKEHAMHVGDTPEWHEEREIKAVNSTSGKKLSNLY